MKLFLSEKQEAGRGGVEGLEETAEGKGNEGGTGSLKMRSPGCKLEMKIEAENKACSKESPQGGQKI